jgi:putative FmdB family regulatory protein
MPLYEFRCDDCQVTFDTLVRSFSAVGEVVCRYCESPNVTRKITTFAVSGFDDPAAARASSAPRAGGGCCGGACGCGH